MIHRLLRLLLIGHCSLVIGHSAALAAADDSLLLGTLPVRVTPKRELTVVAPLTGRLAILVPRDTAALTRDQPWAVIDQDRLALETRALEQARALLEARDVIDWRVDLVTERTKLEDTLGRLKAERTLLDRLEREPDLAALYFRDQAAGAASPSPASPDSAATDSASAPAPSPALADTSPAERLPLMRRRIETEIALIETKLRYIGSARQEELELGALRLKLEQQTFEHERRVQLARLAAPFDAEFTLLAPLPPGGDTIEIRSGDDIARLRDLTEILVQVPVNQAAWRSLPPEKLRFRLATDLGAGGFLEARFHDTWIAARGGREELIYRFAIAPADLAAARPLVGGLLSGELRYASDQPLRLVAKLDLARLAPDSLRSGGWSAAVAALHPGWALACVGQHQLALVPVPAPQP